LSPSWIDLTQARSRPANLPAGLEHAAEQQAGAHAPRKVTAEPLWHTQGNDMSCIKLPIS
jgi:hypothetical protein